MRLFRRRKKSEEWFRELAPIFEQVLEEEFESEPHQLAMHAAWIGGGNYLASKSVEQIDSLKGPWGNGSREKALSLAITCTMSLVSHFYFSVLGSHTGRDVSQSQCRAAAKAGRENIATLLGLTEGYYNPTMWDKVDEQFWYEKEDTDDPDHPSQHGGIPVTGSLLLLDLAVVSCGGQTNIDWALSKFPKRNDNDIVWTTGPTYSPNDFLMLAAIQADAFRRMMAIYRELSQSQSE